MPDKSYKINELAGVSEHSHDEAIQNAIARASHTLKHLDWFEFAETRGVIQDGGVNQFQVKVKISFRLEL